MRQYIAGWSLKIAAIIAKLAFLSVAITELADGVFHTYFIFATLAVGLSRFLSASGEEQIPIELKKRPEEAHNVFSSLAFFFTITATVNFISFFVFFLPLTVVLSLALSVAFAALVGGAVRVNRPLLYETTSNIPYIFFFLLYASLRPTTPEELIFYLSISFFFSSTSAILIYGIADKAILTPIFAWSLNTSLLRRLYGSWRAWIPKSISSAAVLLNLRYPVFILLILGTEKSDQLAFALSIGEIFWQLIMIVVNRRLSFFFKTQITPVCVIFKTIHGLLLASAFAVMTSIFVGIALYFLKSSAWGEFFSTIDYMLLGSAVFLAMTFSCFSFYRVACFYLESEETTKKPVNYLVVQTIILVANSIFFVILLEDIWKAMVLGAIFNISAPLFFCILWYQENSRFQRRTQIGKSSFKEK